MKPVEKIFGILFVGLLAILTGVLSYSIPTIVGRNSTISSLSNQLSAKDSQIRELSHNVFDLQKQVSNLTRDTYGTHNLRKSQILSKRLGWAGGVNLWNRYPQFEGNISYAGLIVVQIYSPWPNDTLEVTYSFQSLNYDQRCPSMEAYQQFFQFFRPQI